MSLRKPSSIAQPLNSEQVSILRRTRRASPQRASNPGAWRGRTSGIPRCLMSIGPGAAFRCRQPAPILAITTRHAPSSADRSRREPTPVNFDAPRSVAKIANDLQIREQAIY